MVENITLNSADLQYNFMCFSCKHYCDYGPVAGREKYNGMCKVDGHETDALVKCVNGKYDSEYD
jgi:hypothetical protein